MKNRTLVLVRLKGFINARIQIRVPQLAATTMGTDEGTTFGDITGGGNDS